MIWPDGIKEYFDAIICCTGFGFAASFLKEFVRTDDRYCKNTREQRAIEVSGLWQAGYGSWTGYASATLIGINRHVKQIAVELIEFLKAK